MSSFSFEWWMLCVIVMRVSWWFQNWFHLLTKWHLTRASFWVSFAGCSQPLDGVNRDGIWQDGNSMEIYRIAWGNSILFSILYEPSIFIQKELVAALDFIFISVNGQFFHTDLWFLFCWKYFVDFVCCWSWILSYPSVSWKCWQG